MLITFTSKSAADVLMYEMHAKPLLDLLGKDVHRGVITAEEAAEAIARIEAAITESKRLPDTDNIVLYPITLMKNSAIRWQVRL